MTSVDEGAGSALHRFDRALHALERAAGFAKPRHQVDLFAAAGELTGTDEGLRALFERAPQFDRAGVFHAGPWEEAARLQANLVGGCLIGEGQYPTIEALSELRLLAIAKGRVDEPVLSPDSAHAFLREMVTLNLGLLFPSETEESRAKRGVTERAHRLLRFVVDELELTGLGRDVVAEIGFRIAQRPLVTEPARSLIRFATQLPVEEGSLPDLDQVSSLKDLTDALGTPSPMAQEARDISAYREAIRSASDEALDLEARAFAKSLKETGLGNPYHAVLLRYLTKHHTSLLTDALGLDAFAQAEFDRNRELAVQLLRVAIVPATADAIEGFVGMLHRGLLSRDEVAGGLRRLVDLDLLPAVRNALRARFPRDSGVSANTVLTAGAIDIVGKPLGVGQGSSPTCQAARGLSLWSLHAPGYLLDVLATAARDGVVEMRFEGFPLKSNELPNTGTGPAEVVGVDPVSSILVPHLDRVYAEMMRRAYGRGVDAHKWVNPSMYGRWVSNGFCTALDVAGQVVDFRQMVRRFYATHHPDYSDGFSLVYPNPVGIFVTDVHGNMLGPHAVSLLRIAPHNDELRAYFFNPNDEGRQNWGQGIEPTVSGNGEEPGESSLRLHHFVSRLYAFHFNPYEEGDAFAVPREVIEDVTQLARESWGRALTWLDESPD